MQILDKNITKNKKKCKVTEYINGKMENFILDNLLTNNLMVKELFILPMEALLKELGYKDII